MFHYFATAMIAASSLAATTKVELQNDYGKALAATRSEQRPLLVVLDIPSDPKASLAADRLDAAGNETLKSFTVCHVDASTEYGRKVAEAFHATSFPHTAIIDKTGAVVLHKEPGQITDDQWKGMLAKYESGERSAPVSHTAYYGGGTVLGAQPTISNSSYCPSCQRKAMGLSN